MLTTINLGVYRILDDRELPTGPDQDREALRLHNARREALEGALQDSDAFEVVSWGEAKAATAHEWVELVVTIQQIASYVVVPGLIWLGRKLAEKGVETAVSEGVKALISRLRTPQEERTINDFQIVLPNGTRITVDPPDRWATITVESDGKMTSIKYTDANADSRD